jgi:hypothetical protein
MQLRNVQIATLADMYKRGELRLPEIQQPDVINELARTVLITGQTQRRLSNKEVSNYLRDIVEKEGVEALRSQCGLTDIASLGTDRHFEFLPFRRQALTDRMNASTTEGFAA